MVAQPQQDRNNGSDCYGYLYIVSCPTSFNIVQRIPGSGVPGEWVVSSAVSTEVSHYQPVYIRRRGHSSFLQPPTLIQEINEMNGILRFFISASLLAAATPASASPVQVC